MRGAVVFDRQAMLRVVQIRPGDETAGVVVELDLRLGPRQSGRDQDQPEPRFHDAFGRRLCQIDGPSEASRARYRSCSPSHAFSSSSLRSRWCNAASSAATASTIEERRPRSASVRTIEVVRSPRRVDISRVCSCERRIRIPATCAIRLSNLTVASIGLHGGTSRPCSHAAVRPEKAELSGSGRWAADSNTIGSSAISRQT
jgi:hypothetical protein